MNSVKLFRWPDCPESVRTQVDHFLTTLRTLLGPNLVGLYLHGSLAMGAPNPSPKDIDLLAVTRHGLDEAVKEQLVNLLLTASGRPQDLEFHSLRAADLEAWRHPLPFDFHYSEGWRERFLAGEWRTLNDGAGHDVDLAAHLTILRERGIALYGPPVESVLPAVPRSDYLAAILDDFASARDGIYADPVYGVLNLCRVLWYLREGMICSKLEAGLWAESALPEEYRCLAPLAVDGYRGEPVPSFDRTLLARFAGHVDDEVKELAARASGTGTWGNPPPRGRGATSS